MQEVLTGVQGGDTRAQRRMGGRDSFVVFKKFIGCSLFREVSQMPETKILCNKCLAQLNQGVNLVFLLYIVANQFFQTCFFAGETALQKD